MMTISERRGLPPSVDGSQDAFLPNRRTTVEETGLSLDVLCDLVLKTIYQQAPVAARDIVAVTKLPFAGVVERVLARLVDQNLAYSAGGLGPLLYTYLLTDQGTSRARETVSRSPYVGPAPVTLANYWNAIRATRSRQTSLERRDFELAFAHLELEPELLNQLGPAVNAMRSLLIFGASGNGKTVIAEAVARLLPGTIWIPHALWVDGEIVILYDGSCHRAVDGTADGDPLQYDARWVHTRRPTVRVGGELNLLSLDLQWNEERKIYEAPLQLKANGGVFLIDDFGRQLASPQDLLNRWIVPLERAIDNLTLRTGKRIEVPFDQILIFSTNRAPRDLGDEAFLRRIRFKVQVGDPTQERFQRIFEQACVDREILYLPEAVTYLIKVLYPRYGLALRAVHPRDLLDHLLAIAHFEGTVPQLTPAALEASFQSVFGVSGGPAVWTENSGR